jgi:hypothetical protein
MERETRRDRRARLAPETLEGRELMSVAALPAVKPGHHEYRLVQPTTPRPHQVHSARVPKPATPAIAAGVSTPDPFGEVTIVGQTYSRAMVRLAHQANGVILQTIRAAANGRFHFNAIVGFGSTPLSLSVTAHGHRPTSIVLPVVRVRPQANPAPGTPPTTSNGSSQTGSQGGSHSLTNHKRAYAANDYYNRWWADLHTLLPDSGGDELFIY